MNFSKFLCYFIVSFVIFGCPGEPFDESPDAFIKVNNSFTEDIYIQQHISSWVPDKFINEEFPELVIQPEMETYYAFDFYNPNFKYRLFIYKKSTMDAYSWQEIKDKGLYDKRYDLTLEELQSMNFMIVYDGT